MTVFLMSHERTLACYQEVTEGSGSFITFHCLCVYCLTTSWNFLICCFPLHKANLTRKYRPSKEKPSYSFTATSSLSVRATLSRDHTRLEATWHIFFIPNGMKMNMVDVAPTSCNAEVCRSLNCEEGIETKPVQACGGTYCTLPLGVSAPAGNESQSSKKDWYK